MLTERYRNSINLYVSSNTLETAFIKIMIDVPTANQEEDCSMEILSSS
jgi:hypothetical protein